MSETNRPEAASALASNTHTNPGVSSAHDSGHSIAKGPSSVRFSDDTNPGSHSPMSNRAQTESTDEITPIRHADGHVGRSYNTNGGPAQTAENTPKKPTSQSNTREPPLEENAPWYRRLAEKYGSVSLDNKGSVARDHLALERTFLAWLRTSLAFASIGIAVTQLFRLNVSIQSRDQSGNSSLYGHSSDQLPYSPMMGHGLPPELIPLLQQLVLSSIPNIPAQTLGPTLLDQLLLLTSSAGTLNQAHLPIGTTAFNEDAAAKLRHAGKPLGATFIGISIIVLCVGFHRYFEAQYWIMRGKFPASRGGIALIGLIAAGLIIASLIVILVVAPGSYQKK